MAPPLTIRIPSPSSETETFEETDKSPQWDIETDTDSLFDDDDDIPVPAHTHPPPIPGLYIPRISLSNSLADSLYQFCLSSYFSCENQNVNQVMLFEKAPPSSSSLPLSFQNLLNILSLLLKSLLPQEIHELLFPLIPTKARQAIINLYHPGEGISPHIDLLGRYDDGIIGVSLGSGCVMQFCSVGTPATTHNLYLPERSVLVLSGDARYKWTHAIEKKTRDYILNEEETQDGTWIDRGRRISITFRWLLPGADVVGGLETSISIP